LSHSYPDPLHYDLKEQIAAFRQVRKTQIFLGVGSDEAIDLLIRIFCSPREDNIIITPPTYGMYKVCAKVNEVNVCIAPLTESFDVDIAAIQSAINEKSKLLFICSPGNPTSKAIPLQQIDQIAAMFPGIVVVDEAYIDFSPVSSACSLLDKRPNVVVLQTLSKAFGLAGIRLGMAFASEEIIQLFNNVKAPYNVNKLTVEVAKSALSNLSLFYQNRDYLLAERDYLLASLQKLSIVKKVHVADANFILFVIPKALQVYKQMADRGVVCRYRGTEMHCEDCLRVTVGTREENDKFLSLLVEVAGELGVV
jgi:histidinol-phosphate aminotransferase